ncbi:MAG: LD-carboxypeptidase [Bacteroidota bacterium]|nr:LD-carboxypeptidase [Bacteroidota bacterium]
MIAPLPLRAGDKIGIIAPSRKVTSEDLDGSVKFLENLGFRIEFGKNLFASENQFAGTDAERAEDFMEMIRNPEIKAIMCARGGYGTARILDYLDDVVIRNNPKWVIGYSDITVLHSYLSEIVGMQSLHATMPVNFKPELAGTDTWQKLNEVLTGGLPEYRVEANPFNRVGTASGLLTGGNLSVLYSLSGTWCDMDTDGKILFIEDLDEYLYHIDRMMMNLRLSGKLACLRGLIVGGMTDMHDNTIPFGREACQIVADAVADYNFPVMFGFPSGHCEPNLPLVMGREMTLEVGTDGGVLR